MPHEVPELQDAQDEAPKRKRRKGYRYIPGKWMIGVPARNLSVSEFEALSKEKQNALLEQGVYEEM